VFGPLPFILLERFGWNLVKDFFLYNAFELSSVKLGALKAKIYLTTYMIFCPLVYFFCFYLCKIQHTQLVARIHLVIMMFVKLCAGKILTLSDPTSDLVLQYDFPVLHRCRKTSDTVSVAFVLPLSEPVRRFFSCSTGFSQQIAQAVLFPFLHVFLF
jgi:hypothetical protein